VADRNALIVAMVSVPLCSLAVFVGHAGVWLTVGILLGGWTAIMAKK
jgi:hypothetical protein